MREGGNAVVNIHSYYKSVPFKSNTEYECGAGKIMGGVALRGGHHCTQPLMHKLGVESTARASFYFYNTKAEVDRFVEVVKEIQKFFAS